MKEALNELKYAVVSGFRSAHDDWVDTVSQLVEMTPWKPAKQAKDRGYEDPFYDEPDEEVSQLASYII
jgi:hypothetical protein